MIKPAQTAKSAAKLTWGSFEDLGRELTDQTARPMMDEALKEFGFPSALGARPKELAQEDLARAREERKIEEMKKEETQKAKAHYAAVQQEYSSFEQKENKQQRQLKQEVVELQSEVVKLAKAAGVDTKAHLEQMPKKVGVLDIKRLTSIVRFLRIKAEESKSAKDLVSQRANAKPATGMLAWVSGKQMKVHEQGTLQLQG